jgi:hypothetical protein
VTAAVAGAAPAACLCSAIFAQGESPVRTRNPLVTGGGQCSTVEPKGANAEWLQQSNQSVMRHSWAYERTAQASRQQVAVLGAAHHARGGNAWLLAAPADLVVCAVLSLCRRRARSSSGAQRRQSGQQPCTASHGKLSPLLFLQGWGWMGQQQQQQRRAQEWQIWHVCSAPAGGATCSVLLWLFACGKWGCCNLEAPAAAAVGGAAQDLWSW